MRQMGIRLELHRKGHAQDGIGNHKAARHMVSKRTDAKAGHSGLRNEGGGLCN